VSTSLTERKSFEFSKREVWQAYERVKANKGAPGVDGVTIEEFEADLRGNLYKVWNRMSSGSYFPPPRWVRMLASSWMRIGRDDQGPVPGSGRGLGGRFDGLMVRVSPS